MNIFLPKRFTKDTINDILNKLPDKLEGSFIIRCDVMEYIDGEGMMFLMILLGEMDRSFCLIEIQGLKGQPLKLFEYFNLCEVYCCTRRAGFPYLSIVLSKITKRFIDMILSGLIIAVALIPSIFIALLIVLESPGSPIYRQKRVRSPRRKKDWKSLIQPSDNDDTFWMYKFRTMVKDAEKTTGAINAEKDDKRVTKIGRFLRKTRLDELPNFLNVLKGDMSIVGPRADRLEIMNSVKDEFTLIFERHRFTKPGITGLAQLELNSDGSIGDTSRSFLKAVPRDLFEKPVLSFRFKMFFESAYPMYFRNYATFLKQEISIICRTPFTMFIKRNVI